MPSETPNIDRCIDNYYALPEWQINVIRQAARAELAALREQVKQARNAAMDEAATAAWDAIGNKWPDGSMHDAQEVANTAILSLKGTQ